MNSLTAFLLARVGEEEQIVAEWPADGRWGPHPEGGMWLDVNGRPIGSPKTRVLNECEAKRRIIHASELNMGDGAYAEGWSDAIEEALQHLAIAYADHPDYDETWRV